ncbi:hypothetical protein [Phaeospirillum tilakii]|uniref:EF-hand domain-containing protein n=1 Tax=Phaeospirillum tilakii TaxID=741673 RepID=A0ABW5CC02_9PROT
MPRVTMPGLAMAALFGLALAGCGTAPADGGGPERGRPGAAPVFSPNAEPLTGGPLGPAGACPAVLADWGRRVGARHDGTLSRAEFLADAEAQFARMDLDHDGFITADELSEYREPFRPRPPEDKPVPPPGAERGGPPGGGRGGPFGGPPGAPRHHATASSADPVMSADTNLDFKVSRDEFLRQAEHQFETLDRDHDGRLDAAELARACPSETDER